MIDLFGFYVFLDIHMLDHKQVRFPRTKKKRIRKKWAKNPENYRDTPTKEMLRVGDSLHAHPATWEKFCRENGVQLSAGVDNLVHATMPGLSDRLLRKTEERLLREMSNGAICTVEPVLGVGAITMESLREAMALMPKLERTRPFFDFMPAPIFDIPLAESGPDFKFTRLPMVYPISSRILLNTV